MHRNFGTIIFALLFLSGGGFAQGERSMGGAVGAVTIDGKIYNQIALRPVVPIWKFGVALDLVFYIDAEGNLHKDEWDFSDSKAIKNTLIDKIYYIRYGKKSDPLYFKIGALDYVNLGYGILVNGYTNTIEYPSVRKVGLDLSVKTKRYSIQGFINDFKENAGLFGARISSPVLVGLPVGLSFVADRNQYLGLKDRDGDGRPDLVDDFPDNAALWLDSDGDGTPDHLDPNIDGDDFTDTLDYRIPGWPLDTMIVLDTDIKKKSEPINIKENTDPISALSVDVGYPILTDGPFKLSIYAQLAKMIGQTTDPKTKEDVNLGMGLIPIGVSAGFGPIHFNLEYRMIPGEGRFDFSYWNRSYDLERAVLALSNDQVTINTKEQSLGKFGPQNGVYARIMIEAGQLLAVGARYQNLKGEIWSDDDQQFITEMNQSLLGNIKLRKSISKLKHAELFYEQRNVTDPFKFELTEGTIMGYRLGLELGSGIVLNYIVQRTYRDLNGNGKIESKSETINTTAIETSFAF